MIAFANYVVSRVLSRIFCFGGGGVDPEKKF